MQINIRTDVNANRFMNAYLTSETIETTTVWLWHISLNSLFIKECFLRFCRLGGHCRTAQRGSWSFLSKLAVFTGPVYEMFIRIIFLHIGLCCFHIEYVIMYCQYCYNIYICCIDIYVVYIHLYFLLQGTPKTLEKWPRQHRIQSHKYRVVFHRPRKRTQRTTNFLPFFIATHTPKTNMEPWRGCRCFSFSKFRVPCKFFGM